MKKALIVSNTSRFIGLFELNNIKILNSMGYQVHCFSNFHEDGYQKTDELLKGVQIIKHNVDFARTPYSFKHISSYRKLKRLIIEEKFDLIHCHTPMGGVLGRLAAKSTKTRPIIYTAHGFHFFDGAPRFNWIFYYPIEKWLSKYTDVLVTINEEDYERAKGFKAKKVFKIPGAGLNVSKFSNIIIDKGAKLEELGIPKNAFVVLSVGEVNETKNHEVIIRALGKLKNPNIYYIICGTGKLVDKLKKLCVDLNIEDNVKFLGFRLDVDEIVAAADVFAFMSRREGLGIAGLEGMAAGLPIITTNIQGIKDYSIDGVTGYVRKPDDVDGCAWAIQNLYDNPEIRQQMGRYNMESVKKFDTQNVIAIMSQIYREVDLNAGNY